MNVNLSPTVSPAIDDSINAIEDALCALTPQIHAFALCIIRKQDAQREASGERIKMATLIKIAAVSHKVDPVAIFEAVCEEISKTAKAHGRKIAIKMNKTDTAILTA